MRTTNGKGDNHITAKELTITLTIMLLTCSIDSIVDIALATIGL